jgi:hypothetical protein
VTLPPLAAGDEAFRCSLAALARGDSMVATAPPAPSWLLLERPGAWPVHALDVLDDELAQALLQRAAEHEARVTLIRRPGRSAAAGRLRWAFADCRPGREGIRWGEVDHAGEVLDLEWAADPGEGEPVALVCAHSRHDVCCAMRGRPVAAVLRHTWRGRVWECSHLGGDRFAATMVVLPRGLCYGRLTPANAPDVLLRYDAGHVVPSLLRGRTALRRHEQAAQALAWDAGHPATGLDDLRPVSSRLVGPDTHVVTLAGTPPLDPPVDVVLRERAVPLGSPATCRSVLPAVGYEFDLVEIRAARAG